MNLLEKFTHVTLDFSDSHEGSKRAVSTEKHFCTLVPRQLLSVRLRISFKNECNTESSGRPSGEEDPDVVITSTLLDFLSHVGEDNFVEAWKRLFECVVVVPFLLPHAEEGEAVHASLATSGDAGAFHFGIPPFWEEHRFAQSVPDGRRPSCCLAGSAMEVKCSTFSVIEESVPTSSEALGTAIIIPQSIVSEYIFSFTVPEVERSLLDVPGVFAFVLMLPFGISNAMTVSSTGDSEYSCGSRNSLTSSSPYRQDQRYILMKVLFRALLDSANDDDAAALYGREGGYFLPFGCHYTSIRVRYALDLTSVTFPLSNDRLLLNLSITNSSTAPITLHGATFDLYTSDVWNPACGSPGKSSLHSEGDPPQAVVVGISPAEQRPGPSGANLQTIDILTKIVTVTPMIASDDRPPFSLQPQETYSFQFVVEVIPQLCYLLNPESLQYVYDACQRDEDLQKTRLDGSGACGDAAIGGYGGRRGPVRKCAETVVTDCYGSPVTTEELLRVLHSSYLSQVYVYFSLGFPDMDGSGDWQSNTLHAQHTARWSFVVIPNDTQSEMREIQTKGETLTL
ncbi:unnamed protein product [Phytomonas sp. Hart1]|nr:unnamed protein product [Phytomonas sp. Hart1]|eukprot:CCW68292.1 unnamed protein product [Phytomonas sp. isolate Hart1]